METIEVSYLPIWSRYLELFEEVELSDRELGILLRAMMEYQFRGVVPAKFTGTLRTVWPYIRSDLDYARAKYETAVINGRKGGRKKKQKEPSETQQNPEEGITITESTTITEPISESNRNTKTRSAQGQLSASAEAEDVSVDEIAFGEFGWVVLTLEQYRNLEDLMGQEALAQCIKYIDESAQCTYNKNGWSDWDTLLRRCYENRWYM